MSLFLPSSLWKSCPYQGWKLSSEIDEYTWPMVGWNIATTYLVAGQLHLQDKYSLLCYLCTVFAYDCLDDDECLLMNPVEFTLD